LARFTFHASTDRRRRSRTVSTSSIGQILRSPRCGFPFCISRPSESPRHSARRRAHVCRRLEDRAPNRGTPECAAGNIYAAVGFRRLAVISPSGSGPRHRAATVGATRRRA
jgi:hypothetical protein